MARPVYVVHCVDTEGPLHESVEATFERLEAIFGIDLEPSVALLRQLQAGEVDLGGLEQAVRKVVDPHLLDYNDTWDKIDEMLASCLSPAFREQTVDSDGHGWVYNWFCVDHVDYDLNPRRRDAEAEADRPVVLAFTNHDFRDMRPDIDGVRELVIRVGREFPDVPFFFSEALTAMREALQLPAQPACELEATLSRTGPSTHVMEVRSQVPTFGPQPWLALRTVAGTYHHDNLDIDEPFHRWRYVFDEETYPLGALDAIGLAANNAYGVTTVVNVDPATGAASRRVLNDPSATVAASHGS